jgi:hypothetical protein
MDLTELLDGLLLGFTSYTRLDNGTLHIGTTNGISTYTGFSDNGWLSF